MSEDKKKRKARTRTRTRKKTIKMITQERKKLSRRKNKTQKSKILVKTKKRKTKKRTTNRRKYSMKGGFKRKLGKLAGKAKEAAKGAATDELQGVFSPENALSNVTGTDNVPEESFFEKFNPFD